MERAGDRLSRNSPAAADRRLLFPEAPPARPRPPSLTAPPVCVYPRRHAFGLAGAVKDNVLCFSCRRNAIIHFDDGINKIRSPIGSYWHSIICQIVA